MGRRGRILYRGGHRRGGGRRGAELLLYWCGHGDEEVELGRRGCCSGGERVLGGWIGEGGGWARKERRRWIGRRSRGWGEAVGWLDRSGRIPRKVEAGRGRIPRNRGSGWWHKEGNMIRLGLD